MNAAATFTWDGLDASAIAARLGLPRVSIHSEVASTQDVAHELAEQGAAPGTLVVADAQRSGRGRQGRSWSSQPGRGVWCTIVERPEDPRALDVLSIRVGLRLAEALDDYAGERVGVKWPNDLLLARGKVAGVLVEARWTGSSLAWVAVGVGVNVARPDVEGAAGLRPGTERLDVLRAVVTAVRSAAAARGSLSTGEVERYGARDTLAGRRIVSPADGVVAGVDPSGALIVRPSGGASMELHRTGTVRLAEDA